MMVAELPLASTTDRAILPSSEHLKIGTRKFRSSRHQLLINFVGISLRIEAA
jgi:hypothetical protein